MSDALLWHRIQFAFTITFHDLFPQLTMGLALSARYGLGVALVWWAVGIALVAGYFTHLFRSARGKVRPDSGHGLDASAPSLPNP